MSYLVVDSTTLYQLITTD